MPRAKKQHLTKRKDGRYCCKYHGIQFFGRTEDEAFRAREAYINSGIVPSVYTVGTYCAHWLPIHKADVKIQTYNGYAPALERIVRPIADIRLSDLNTEHIAEAYAALVGMSSGYIRRCRSLLSEALDSAVEAGYLQRNPCRSSIRPPRGTSGSHRTITEEEKNLILTVPHRMQVPALVMLYCGLRRGEVMALTPKDFTADGVVVNKAVTFPRNQQTISTTKTPAGNRVVPMPSVLKPFLAVLDGFPLKGMNGSPMSKTAWLEGWKGYLKALSRAAGHTISFRPHDLRVTYCTMARDAGVDPKVLQRWMGHENTKMIMQVYDQPGANRERDAFQTLNNSLSMQNGMQKKIYRVKRSKIKGFRDATTIRR